MNVYRFIKVPHFISESNTTPNDADDTQLKLKLSLILPIFI